MEVEYGRPFIGDKLEKTKKFVQSFGLSWEPSVQTTVNLVENGEIIASGSREFNVLKCICVDPFRQGDGLAASLLTELIKDAFQTGCFHLFIYTKPENIHLFQQLGFYKVVVTNEVALLENERNGIEQFLQEIKVPGIQGEVGCIVANCNPFTKGHLYLIETAAERCDFIYLFILSEQRSRFSAEVRLRLAQAATAHLTNVRVCQTGDYLVSSATFPDYFIKDKPRSSEISCAMDMEVFAKYFAEVLNIKKRFVGDEPFSYVTKIYNEQMLATLPGKGIEVIELPRCEIGGEAVSASKVRRLYDEGRLDEIRPLVPDCTFEYLERMSINEKIH